VLNILGFYIQELSDELALIFKLQSEAGVLVADVEEGSAASKAGFLRGDVITRVNDKSVTSVDQLESFIKETKKAGRLKMEVEREGKSVLMKMDSPY
jgi:S1-C subfamily serine protease